MKLVKPVDWSSDKSFIVDGLEFTGDLDTYAMRTTREQVVILKDTLLMRQYLDFLAYYETGNVLDLGIWQGGSALFYGLATDVNKVVAIDIAARNPVLDEIVAGHDLADRVKLHFNTSQDDRPRILSIIDREFGDEPLDLVIDDASHLYAPTKRCFETVYPRLRVGGLYIIEDWHWAHVDLADYQTGAKWGDEAALTNLIFELVVAYGSTPGLFWNIIVRDWFVAVQKGSVPVTDDFRLDDLVRLRGKRMPMI